MRRRTYPDLVTFLEETGTTQVELAMRLGLSQPYMSRIVRGLQQPPLDLALQIARMARVPVESLVRADLDIPVQKL
jgi:transcriptional regulator with XRE-family HTH domain